MDWTKVTPFSFTSSSKIVDRGELPSGVPSLLQVKDGTGQPCATHTNTPVLPAVIGVLSEMITMDVSVRLLETGSQWLCYKCSIYTYTAEFRVSLLFWVRTRLCSAHWKALISVATRRATETTAYVRMPLMVCLLYIAKWINRHYSTLNFLRECIEHCGVSMSKERTCSIGL